MSCLPNEIIGVKGEWVFFPFAHQEQIRVKLRKNIERQKKFKELIKGAQKMNFSKAISKIQEGFKVRRSEWDQEMYMWWHSEGIMNNIKSFILHTHPYYEHQESATTKGGFLYVVENDDAIAEDWEIAM